MSAVFRPSALPTILAVVPVLFVAIDLPLTQRWFLPPQDTVESLVRESLSVPDPAEPFVRDIVYHRDLLREYRLDVYGPLPASGPAPGATKTPRPHASSPARESSTPPERGALSSAALESGSLSSAAPVIIFFHGGSWLRGDKITIMIVDRFLRRMREQGWYVVAVNYTTSALRGLGGPVDNARRALAWVQTNAADWGWDPRRVGLYGVSAGAHVALMAATPSSSEDAPAYRPALILAECGPVDLVEMREGDAFEQSASFRFWPQRRLEALSPVRSVDGAFPPTLIYHGDADETVHVDQARLLADALSAAQVPHDLVIYPEGNHAFLNYTSEQWFEQETRALAWMDAVFTDGTAPESSGPAPASMDLYR